jgi:hypothetical protein
MDLLLISFISQIYNQFYMFNGCINILCYCKNQIETSFGQKAYYSNEFLISLKNYYDIYLFKVLYLLNLII